jgi:glutamine synthetase
MIRTPITYVWQNADGDTLGKVRTIASLSPSLKDMPLWRFDGGSTGQAEVDKSDCILKPVRLYRGVGTYVLCEVLDSNGLAHKSNYRRELERLQDADKNSVLMGIEQEFIFTKIKGEKIDLYQPPNSYCTADNQGRDVVATHMYRCFGLNLPYYGNNAEVTPQQWEYQLGTEKPLELADALVLSRWLLKEICPQGTKVSFDPKPFPGVNGSGAHINISTLATRSCKMDLSVLAEKFRHCHEEHMDAYGKDNYKRMLGVYETASFDEFTIGVGARNASIRIPDGIESQTYIEDRRPAANVNPYRAFARIMQTLES